MSTNLDFNSNSDKDGFRALQEPESGGWLHVISSLKIGTTMNDQVLLTCTSLRLVVNLNRIRRLVALS